MRKVVYELIKEGDDFKKSNDTNSQKLAGMIIKILKGLGIFLIALFIISIILVIMGLVLFNQVGVENRVETTVVEVQEDIEDSQ